MRSPTLTLGALERTYACGKAVRAFMDRYPGQKSVSIKKILPELTEDHPDWLVWCLAEDPAIAKLFIKAGADMEAKNNDGYTPLMEAASYLSTSSTKVVAILLDAGAKVNVEEEFGWTPLHFAARWGSLDSVNMLLKAGADVNAQEEGGDTPLDSALEESHKTLLRKHGAKTSKELEEQEPEKEK